MAGLKGREVAETVEPTDENKRATLIGAYDMCDRLLRSVRFNRPQRELVEEQATWVRAQLEELGVEFVEKWA
jgi:hypothetical protein